MARWESASGDNAAPSLPRSGHAASRLPDGHTHDIIIFGGYTEDGQNRETTNEAWVYSAEKKQWTDVKYAGQQVPQARLVSQAVVIGDQMYVIGGWDPGLKKDGGTILDDIWKLDLNNYQWSQVETQGEKLGPTSRHQATAVGSTVYIHNHRTTSTIMALDTLASPPNLTSIPVSTSEGYPASRGLHSMTVVDGTAYIFGGASKEGKMLGDCWKLDLTKNEKAWKEVKPTGCLPHVRCSHAAAAVGDNLVFFGGSYYKVEGGLQPLNDTFVLDLANGRWLWPDVDASSAPSPRNAHSLTALTDGHLVLHGGWDPFKVSFNDTYGLNAGSLDLAE